MKQTTDARLPSSAQKEVALPHKKGSLQKKPLRCLLDTNFILTCVKQKIDFFEDIKLMGIQIIIPQEVVAEIERLKTPEAKTALALLQKNKFKKIEINKGHVDKKIISYLKDKPKIILATLDKELQSKVSNPKMIVRERKRLEII